MSSEYKNNHYVPVWYQKRFVLNPSIDNELYYLSLKPPTYIDSKGKSHTGNAVRRLGFRHCFAEEDLYTLNFQGIESRNIEKLFFGDTDYKGKGAVDWCDKFSRQYFKGLFLLYYNMICTFQNYHNHNYY